MIKLIRSIIKMSHFMCASCFVCFIVAGIACTDATRLVTAFIAVSCGAVIAFAQLLLLRGLAIEVDTLSASLPPDPPSKVHGTSVVIRAAGLTGRELLTFLHQCSDAALDVPLSYYDTNVAGLASLRTVYAHDAATTLNGNVRAIVLSNGADLRLF